MHRHTFPAPALACATAFVLAGCARTPASGAPTTTPAAVVAEAPEITAAELRRDLSVFASDSFRGRETGTEAGVMAARFLAQRLGALGIEPAGDSGYYQRVVLVRESLGPRTRFTVTEGGRETVLPKGEPLLPILQLGEGAPAPKHAARGDLVFAGYGVQDRATGRDDFTGLDLRGKVAVVLHGAPAGVDSAKRKQLESQEALGMRIGQLMSAGVSGIIVLATAATEELYRLYAPSLRATMGPERAGAPQSDAERPLPMILLGIAQRGSPLLPAGWPADDRAQPLRGRSFAGEVALERTVVPSYNVVGIVRGRDPKLASTYVAFGAHLDHVGIGAPVAGDSIYNGADDDGSGSIGVLAIARSIQGMPTKPRRSTLFVWHTGEEKGLLGSSWFVEHPTVPIDSIVAQINADMIGRNGASTERGTIGPDAANTVYVVGPAAAPNNQSRTLGAMLDAVNAAEPRPLRFDREWDSPTHPERIYFRSDHYNYARKGIPIVFLTTGLHPDYHKPSDEVAKIEFDKMARIAQLMRDLGVAVGNRESRPR
jgi:hypothetical protein